MRQLLKFIFSRMVIVGLLILLQMTILVMFIGKLSNHFVYVYAGFSILSIILVVWLVNKDSSPDVKLPWVITIMLVPIFGGLFYLILGNTKLTKKTQIKLKEVKSQLQDVYDENDELLKQIEDQSRHIASQSSYIKIQTKMPVYTNTDVEYLPLGEIKFERLKRELEQAKHYIFMEYFIIQEGVMWDSLLEILVRKVQEGVDVRVMYDDIGCIQTLPYKYNEKLEKLGIQCVVFNPLRPALATALHNRDHRKIVVIDGHTGFMGGINLADEYINAYAKHGHWKDCAIVMQGEAVWSLTVMFLEIWSFYRPLEKPIETFKPYVHHPEPFKSDGYVQPYGDTPLDKEYVGEAIYLNMINQATDYIYINTPYFIVGHEMITALTLAAKRGVDVKIVTPHMADKWYVHTVTQSYYPQLIKGGVKVYEYTPGFVHAKTFVVDGEVAVVGTINLDYRSLYHHYECATWLYQSKAVTQLREDYEKTLEVCTPITLEICREVPIYIRVTRGIIKLIAPLM